MTLITRRPASPNLRSTRPKSRECANQLPPRPRRLPLHAIPLIRYLSTAWKRLSTGSLTEADIMNAMQEYNPEQVLMARFEIPPLEAYLKEHYTLVLSAEFFRLFIRNDIKPLAP